MKFEQTDTAKLSVMLEQLSRAIEELLLTGLTTASEATIQTLNVSFQEASRAGLLRLGSTLRVACEELSRYTKNQPDFSAKRFSFFLNRSWLLSRGLLDTIQKQNKEDFERLTWTASSVPVGSFDLVTLGVVKKLVPGAFCAFEFRMRSLTAIPGLIESGQKLVWSAVFPIKQKLEIPPEAFLHLPQKQKFVAFALLEGKRVTFDKSMMTVEKSGACRISLGENSLVSQGDKFTDWSKFVEWSVPDALERLRAYEPGPLDLEVELQEEVFLEDWQLLDSGMREDDSQLVFPLIYKNALIEAVVSRGTDGDALRKAIERAVRLEKKPTLYGLMHYERSRLILQPLSFIAADRPEYVTLSPDKIDRVALLRALNF